MARLPQPHSDVDEWGDILNDFLDVEHREDGSLKLRSEHYISVKDAPFHARGDGLADDTKAIKAAFDAANAAQKPVFFPPGKYICNWLYKKYPPRIWAQRGTVTVLARNTTDCTWNFGVTSYGNPIMLTADFTQGSRHLHVASTRSLREDDLIVVRDNVGGREHYQAQTLRIYRVDSSTQLTTAEPANTTFMRSNRAVMQPLPKQQQGGYIHGIAFKSIAPATATAGFVRLWYCRDIDIDIEGESATNPGLILEGCYQFRVRAVARRYRDQTITGLLQFGYGVNVSGASAHGRVDVLADQVRHAVSVTGPSYDVNVTGMAYGTTSTAWDAHSGSTAIVFAGCHAVGCEGFGFALRGKRQDIQGGLADNCLGGVFVFDQPGDNEIKGLRISRVCDAGPRYGNTGNGILVSNPSSGLIIKDNEIDTCTRNGISFRAAGVNRDVVISGNIISNVGKGQYANDQCGIQQLGSASFAEAHISRNVFKDTQPSPTTLYGIQLSSLGQNVTIHHNEFYNGIAPFNGAGVQGAASIGRNAKTHAMVEHCLQVPSSAHPVFDASLAGIMYFVLTENVASATIIHPTDGQQLCLVISQGALGGHQFTWPENIRWSGSPPTLSTKPHGIYACNLIYVKQMQAWVAIGQQN